ARLKLVMPEVLRLVRQRQVRIDGQPCTDPARRLRPGQQIDTLPEKTGARGGGRGARGKEARGEGQKALVPRPSPLAPRQRPVIRYADEHIVVVDKPAGLTTMRHKEEVRAFGER